jgi:hypothetical protein
MTVHTDEAAELHWFLDRVGSEWYLGTDARTDNIPAGHRKLMYVHRPPGPGIAGGREAATAAPGSAWALFSEPNRPEEVSPESLVEPWHDLAESIRSADPSATVLSPPVLNWMFTCSLCAGYTPGFSWLHRFRAAHRARYGVEPAVSAWAINAYPLDWASLPTVDHELAIQQIVGLRSYLDSWPSVAGDPIWVTELGLHWGYEAVRWEDGCSAPLPGGEYQTDAVVDYLHNLLSWIDANAEAMNIEMAMVYVSYRDLGACTGDAYSGMTMFDGPEPGAELTAAGQEVLRHMRGEPH